MCSWNVFGTSNEVQMITLFGKTEECIVGKTLTQDLRFIFSDGFEYLFFLLESILIPFELLKWIQEHSRRKKNG